DPIGTRLLDEVVVALSAIQRISALTAFKTVVTGIANQHVVLIVAGTVEVLGAKQCEVFQRGAQRVVDARLDGVLAFPCGFNDLVVHVIDHIGVVTLAANQRIGARTTIQTVGGRVAKNRVVAAVASATMSTAASCQNQLLDIGGEGVIAVRID